MAIEVRAIGADLYAPLAICDHCGKPITDAASGVYCWGLAPDGETWGLKFYHKNEDTHPRCRQAWETHEQLLRDQGWLDQWETLSDFVRFFAANLEHATA